MNNNYNFSIKAIDESVEGIKDAFMNVYYREMGSLSYLLGLIESLPRNEKVKYSALAQRQVQTLNSAMEQFDTLVDVLKQIDSDGKKIETVAFNVAQRVRNNAASQQQVVQRPPVKKKVEQNEEKFEEKNIEKTVAVPAAPAEVNAVTPSEEAKVDAAPAATEEVSVVTPVEEVKVDAAPVAPEEVSAVTPVEEANVDVALVAPAEVSVVTTGEEATVDAAPAATEEVSVVTPAEANVNDGPVIEPVPGIGSVIDVDALANAPKQEDDRQYISGTPDEVDKEFFEMFKAIPGMENIELGANGKPDFSKMLPKDLLEKAAKNSDGSLSGIISALAKEERAKSGVYEPVIPVIDSGENSSGTTLDTTIGETASEPAVVQDNNTTVDTNNSAIIPTVAPPAAPSESVVSTIDIADEITGALQDVAAVQQQETVIVPVAQEQSNEVIPTVNNGQVIPTDTVPLVIPEAETVADSIVVADGTSVDDNSGMRKFMMGEGQPKAILVSEMQYSKLSGSRVTQEALLKFKHVLPGTTSSTAVAVTSDVSNMTDDEKSRTIEAMMADANALYNAGKIEEAQAMYEKISEMNKTLVKN